MSLTITLQRTTYNENDSIDASAFNAQSVIRATVDENQNYAFALGTAGAPSIAFFGDANTGIYSPGVDQLALVTAGVARLTIGATGLVTVGGALTATGTVTASGDLSVAGALTASSTLAVTGVLSANGGMTGAVTAPVGLAGAPSIAFFGDANTGIYSPGADQLALVTAGVARLTIGATGDIGINTSPAATLDVGGTFGSARAKYVSAYGSLAAYNSATGGIYLHFNAGIGRIRTVADNAGTAAPFSIEVGNGLEALLIHASKVVRLSGYGAGTLVTDSTGTITASSDAKLKDVIGTFQRGLADVLKLQPKRFKWTVASGMDPYDENVGFVAQDVLEAIPEAVGQYRTVETVEDDPEHKGQKRTKKERRAVDLLTLSDRPIIAALVNAVKELAAQMAVQRQSP